MNIAQLRAGLALSSALLVVTADPLAAAQPPKALSEHTVEIAWQEVREDRKPPDGEWREIHSYRSSVIYVSSSGRVFRREKTVNMGYRRKSRGALDANVNGGVTFNGNSMEIIAQAATGSAARRTVVSFDQNFQSCNASIITGKTGDTSSFTQRAIAGGGLIEVRSVRTNSVTCQVFDGNKL